MDTEGTTKRNTAMRESGVQNEVARAVVAVVAFGLLIALWVVLWVPSAPLP
jgi:hypothetical protein